MAILDIKVKRFNDRAHLPKFQTIGSAAADLVAVRIIKNGLFRVWYDCEIAMAIPKGYVGLIFSRSSISEKSITLANSVGVVDSDYRGSFQVRFNRTFWGIFKRNQYKVGERCAQLMIVKIPKVTFTDVKALDETTRGTGGFGSSGK